MNQVVNDWFALKNWSSSDISCGNAAWTTVCLCPIWTVRI